MGGRGYPKRDLSRIDHLDGDSQVKDIFRSGRGELHSPDGKLMAHHIGPITCIVSHHNNVPEREGLELTGKGAVEVDDAVAGEGVPDPSMKGDHIAGVGHVDGVEGEDESHSSTSRDGLWVDDGIREGIPVATGWGADRDGAGCHILVVGAYRLGSRERVCLQSQQKAYRYQEWHDVCVLQRESINIM